MTNTPRDEDRATWRNTPRPSRVDQATDAGYEPLQNLRDDVSRALEGQELAVRN